MVTWARAVSAPCPCLARRCRGSGSRRASAPTARYCAVGGRTAVLHKISIRAVGSRASIHVAGRPASIWRAASCARRLDAAGIAEMDGARTLMEDWEHLARPRVLDRRTHGRRRPSVMDLRTVFATNCTAPDWLNEWQPSVCQTKAVDSSHTTDGRDRPTGAGGGFLGERQVYLGT
jgi:hypothetical protein